MMGGGRHWAPQGVPYSGVVDINAGGLRRGRRGRLINLYTRIPVWVILDTWKMDQRRYDTGKAVTFWTIVAGDSNTGMYSGAV